MCLPQEGNSPALVTLVSEALLGISVGCSMEKRHEATQEGNGHHLILHKDEDSRSYGMAKTFAVCVM